MPRRARDGCAGEAGAGHARRRAPHSRSLGGDADRRAHARGGYGLTATLALACAAVVVDPCIGLAQAQHASTGPQRVDFDIPSQPLEDALVAFTVTTGVNIAANGSLVAGRHSTAVSGTKTPAEAIRVLLTGTGLIARPTNRGALTLAVQSPRLPGVRPDLRAHKDYAAWVQDAVRRTLCRHGEARPAYKVAMQIWIGPSGAVERAVLAAGTTGDAARDKTLTALFREMTIGAPPPPGLPQPATFVILPREKVLECAAVNEGRR